MTSVAQPHAVPDWAHYRTAATLGESCGTCVHLDRARSTCKMFNNAPVQASMVCDRWSDGQEDAHPGYDARPEDRFGRLTPDDIRALAASADALTSPWMGVRKETVEPVTINPLPGDSRAALQAFWRDHPDLREACVAKYGHDPVDDEADYWRYGIAEPEHAGVLAMIRANGGTFSLPLVRQWEREELEEAAVAKADMAALPRAAGVAVRAADTGRVLMIQRSNHDPKDRAAGTWEFPGGKLNDGEHPHDGAKREWQEEMGTRLPRGKHVGSWRSGVYQGFIHEVPNESSVKTNLDPEDRRVMNPDDPDGDHVEVAAWWHPDHLKRLGALRPELRASRPWAKVRKAEGTLYVARHGKTRMNSDEPAKDLVRGWRNPPLDNVGLTQARGIAKMLAGRGIEEIHATDLKRGAQTAAIIGRRLHLAPQPSQKWRPWRLGKFEGVSSATVTPELRQFASNPERPVPGGGETFASFRDRFLPALEDLLEEVRGGETILLVTHSRNIKLIEAWLAKGGDGISVNTLLSAKSEPAQVIALTPDGARWRMAQVAAGGVTKAQAHAAEVNLRVHGVSRTPAGQHVYRMVTRDGQYVGRTNPTRVRARKGDVLKIQAANLLQDAQGDLRWMNANVISGYNDAPHSWRDLEALAGAALVKDTAPGPAGDIPPAGDEGTDRNTPSNMTLSTMGTAASSGTGPSSSSVHVNVPLPNISVGYQTVRGRRGRPVLQGEFLPIGKAQAMKQLVYGVVLEPNSFDSQDDFMLPHHVERSAHNYLKKAIRGQSSVAKLQHRRVGFRRDKPSIVPVESFIAPVDFHVEGMTDPIKKGSWVMCMHVEDPALWQDFLDGKYTGFSVGGTGVRQSLHASTNLLDHDLIGTQQPNYFEPSPYAALSPPNG